MQIPFGEAVNCNFKPVDVEFMDPATCWFGPGVIDYDAQFECEKFLESKLGYDVYKSEGQNCVMDCALKDDDVLKDMHLNRDIFMEEVKKRTHTDYNIWESAIKAATDECFDMAEKKLATLNATDYDDTKKCNPVPKILMQCLTAKVLVYAPEKSEGLFTDMFCSKLRDFYKTCDFIF